MWRYFTMMVDCETKVFYAPDLDTAFGLARGWRPMSKEWTCLGSTTEEP